MTETGFYILLCLREEAHDYSIIQKVAALTDGEIKISPGTLYGSLSKMAKGMSKHSKSRYFTKKVAEFHGNFFSLL